MPTTKIKLMPLEAVMLSQEAKNDLETVDKVLATMLKGSSLSVDEVQVLFDERRRTLSTIEIYEQLAAPKKLRVS